MNSLSPRELRVTLLGIAVAVLAIAVIPVNAGAFDLGALLRGALVTAVLFPLLLRLAPPGRWMVFVACFIALAPVTIATIGNIGASDHLRSRNHDGGVYLTSAAAEDVLAARNPYAEDHSEELPEFWNPLGRVDGVDVVNPVVRHYPYLPGWFAVQVPFVAAADAVGLGWDPRLIGLAILFATVAVIARRPGSEWPKAAAILGVGTSFTVLYAGWGTNDAVVAALVVMASLLAAKYPRTAGALLALAISGKFLVGLAVIPLAIVVIRTQGAAALRQLWTLPALLIATCLPFLLADPAAFVEDTLLFNLGVTELRYPTSGLGLPVIAKGIFNGAVLQLTTVLLGLGALALPAFMAWRSPRFEIVPLATALGIAGLLIPARTFQQPYLTLLIVLASSAWLLLPEGGSPPLRPEHEDELARQRAKHAEQNEQAFPLEVAAKR